MAKAPKRLYFSRLTVTVSKKALAAALWARCHHGLLFNFKLFVHAVAVHHQLARATAFLAKLVVHDGVVIRVGHMWPHKAGLKLMLYYNASTPVKKPHRPGDVGFGELDVFFTRASCQKTVRLPSSPLTQPWMHWLRWSWSPSQSNRCPLLAGASQP